MAKVVRDIKEKIIRYATKHPFRMMLWLGLLIIVIIPFGLQLSMWLLSFGVFKVGTNDGWLGFWGGYLGAMIAIGGVYWQVNKESIQTKVQVKQQIEDGRRERDLTYKSYLPQIQIFAGRRFFSKSEARKIALINYLSGHKGEDTAEYIKEKYSDSLETLNIVNRSAHSLYDVVVEVTYVNREMDAFRTIILEKNQ